jgi:putative hydrolase of the HAD superfamily
MPLDTHPIRAVVFDYGNTIIPFGREEIARLDAALQRGLGQFYPMPGIEAVARVRDRNRMAPYQGDPPQYLENDLEVITRELVRELYDTEPGDAIVEALIEVRFRAFLDVLETPGYVAPLLERLGARYRLAMLSNYPSGRSIRAGLEKGGIDRYFEAVVVSGDLGICKPHPETFAAVEFALDLPPAACVYVGDNWLADVQGAKRAGWQMVHTRQWLPPEDFAEERDDFPPDATIQHFTELEGLLHG